MTTTIQCLECTFKITAQLDKNIESYKEKHTYLTGHKRFNVKQKKRLQL